MFLGCCLLSALLCPRPSELAGTRSYGLDRGASASASRGRCLWEESCWKGAAEVTPKRDERRGGGWGQEEVDVVECTHLSQLVSNRFTFLLHSVL